FKMISAIQRLRGMTPWVLVDFRSPRRQQPYYQDFWNRKGLVTDAAKKKLEFWTMKQLYEDVQRKYAH
ncbi:beta-glucuronidase, partial [Telluria sp. Tellsp104]